MSRRDPRKALRLPVDRDLRRALRAKARDGEALASVARRLFRGVDPAAVRHVDLPVASGRVLLVQLSRSERLTLSEIAERLQVSQADALRYALVHAT